MYACVRWESSPARQTARPDYSVEITITFAQALNVRVSTRYISHKTFHRTGKCYWRKISQAPE